MDIDKNKLYQIGEVSKLCNISIKTLRYYDEIDLLKPSNIDEFSNYRYYSHDELVFILIIKQLKEAGFSLKEIKRLSRREDMKYNQKKFNEKCKEIDDKINDLLRIKRKLRFCLLENNNKPKRNNDLNFKIKYIPKMYISYFRSKGTVRKEEFAVRYCKLISLIEKNNLHTVKNVMALYHDEFDVYKNENNDQCDIEVCAQVSETKEIPGIVRKFGGFKALSVIHYGNYDNMQDIYKRMVEYIKEKGYEICGPAIDNYIVDIVSTSDPNNYVTELLIPIK